MVAQTSPGPVPRGPHPAACSAWRRSFTASCQQSQPPAPTGVRARAAFRKPGCISPAEAEQGATLQWSGHATRGAQWGLGLWSRASHLGGSDRCRWSPGSCSAGLGGPMQHEAARQVRAPWRPGEPEPCAALGQGWGLGRLGTPHSPPGQSSPGEGCAVQSLSAGSPRRAGGSLFWWDPGPARSASRFHGSLRRAPMSESRTDGLPRRRTLRALGLGRGRRSPRVRRPQLTRGLQSAPRAPRPPRPRLRGRSCSALDSPRPCASARPAAPPGAMVAGPCAGAAPSAALHGAAPARPPGAARSRGAL
ncbi:hypothetical protein P7K49_031295 [Saguinus oedipus]|uniref:Uncharacterized protein n=1 Tax=Saguinus oedipus TaxID=9490 RepID=A0ABQ9TZU5_SAGOE|nr:hypothetical protein P7K49_031295 [Saguinus oedipus]